MADAVILVIRAASTAMRVARCGVFVILFRTPPHSKRHYIGRNAWDNRIDWKELSSYIDSLRPGIVLHTVTLPYSRPVPAGIEENPVIRIPRDR